MKKQACACGATFASIKELRFHIALLTPRWPAAQCTEEHHDPKSAADVTYWLKHPKVGEDRRFKGQS